MIFGQDRQQLRRMYRDAWKKRVDGLPLSPLERQIAAVIEEHPEYQDTIVRGDVGADYEPDSGQSNPYLHMGFHLGLREQVATDRPAGIRNVFHRLAEQHGNPHDAEHRMIECLAETLWEAQRDNVPPDEERYFERLQRL